MAKTNVNECKPIRLKRDDMVEVITGRDKGKQGQVIETIPAKNAVLVRGINMVSKAVRRKTQQDKGGIIQVEAPINVSNVMIVCKKCGKGRIGYEIKDGKKIRVCRKCGEAL